MFPFTNEAENNYSFKVIAKIVFHQCGVKSPFDIGLGWAGLYWSLAGLNGVEPYDLLPEVFVLGDTARPRLSGEGAA